MAAIGGNSSGQGSHLTINMLPMHVFEMDDSFNFVVHVYVLTSFVWL